MQTSLFLVKKTNLLKTNQSIDEIKTKCSTLCIVRKKRKKIQTKSFLRGYLGSTLVKASTNQRCHRPFEREKKGVKVIIFMQAKKKKYSCFYKIKLRDPSTPKFGINHSCCSCKYLELIQEL